MPNKANTDFSEWSLSPSQSRWLWTAFVFWQLLPFWLVVIDFAIGSPSYIDSSNDDSEHLNTLQYMRGLVLVGAVAIVFAQLFLLTGKVVCVRKHRVFWTLTAVYAAFWFYQGCSYLTPFRFPERYRAEEYAYQIFFRRIAEEPYLMMPLLSLIVVLTIARLFHWQIDREQYKSTQANSLQFTMRELIIVLLLAPILFPPLRIWLGQLRLPVSFDELADRTFGTRNYGWYNVSFKSLVGPKSLWTFGRLFLFDWICFILKCSLIVVPLLYLRRNTPMWVWSVLLAGVAIGQLILDRVSIHHEILFQRDDFPFWIFSPIQVLFIFVSWYLLLQLGYQFIRVPKPLPAPATSSTPV
ncbi:MAG: hypothetical protein ACO1RA_12830 [Planctomycetaceae bacterium]